MIPVRNFVLVMLLLLAGGAGLLTPAGKVVPMSRPFAQFPATVGGWRMTNEEVLTPEVLRLLRPTDYLVRSYVGPGGTPVSLYVGYHDGSRDSGEIHSPKHCLPGSGWDVQSSRILRVTVDGHELNIVHAVYQRGGRKTLFLYWYQVMDRAVTSEVGLKAAEVLNAMLHGRKDAAFVRIVLPNYEEGNGVEEQGLAFLRTVYPLVMEFLPKP